jgi:DNA-binding CsgD family transcriptional regulator
MSLSLAEQLAPLAPKPNPNAWRSLMKPDELAAFDAGDYDALHYETGAKDLRKAPREADRISRDNRLLPFLENDSDEVSEKLAPVYPSPEENLLATRYAKAIEEINAYPYPCNGCGLDFSADEAGVTILTRAKPPRGYAYCQTCWNALGVVLDQDPWLTGLPVREQKVWLMTKQNCTQQEIAEKLKLTQQAVSEIKLRLVRQINDRQKFNAAKRREMKYGQWVQ